MNQDKKKQANQNFLKFMKLIKDKKTYFLK